MGDAEDEWAGQNTIGAALGVSGIEAGRLLVLAGLRDPDTKMPTAHAISIGAASEPLTGRDREKTYTYFKWRTSTVLPILWQTQQKQAVQPSLEQRIADLERRVRSLESRHS